MTVLNSVRDIATMMVHGLTNGASPVMSFNYGEKAYDKVKKAIKFVTVVCFSYALFVWGIIKIAPEFFIRIFNSEPALLEKGVPALHIYFFGFCFMASQERLAKKTRSSIMYPKKDWTSSVRHMHIRV